MLYVITCDIDLENELKKHIDTNVRIHCVPDIVNLFPCPETKLYIVITAKKDFLSNLRKNGTKFDCHLQKRENSMGNYETLYKLYIDNERTESYYKSYLDDSPDIISHFYIEDIGHTWSKCSPVSDSNFVLIETKNRPGLHYTSQNDYQLIYMYRV